MAKSSSKIIVSGAGRGVWARKMHATLWLLFSAAVVCANQTQERRSKPYIADALGNTLPPPSNLPATVGSPVNLLTPDRYEFYTFDESGELVKRLMTLEEIQAIVAAGEDTEGLVTFANDNQPTIAFNFSQPPYTKVHSVVTNVQNVLKAQMEAHKNKPLMRPTLDTPDVSDSWSLILPSIFGNTGLDITPDKTTGSYITPETDTIELDHQLYDEESLSKEGNGQILTSSTEAALENDLRYTSTTKPKLTQKTSTSTTTFRPSTTRIPATKNSFTKPTTTTTIKPRSTTTTTTTKPRPTTTITVKLRPITTTTSVKPKPTTTTTTTFRPKSTSTTTTTVKPSPTTTTTSVKPKPTITTTTTFRPKSTSTTTTTDKPSPTTTTTVRPRTTTTTTTTTIKPSTKPTLILSSTTVKPISTTAKDKTSPSTEIIPEKVTVATERLEIDSHHEQITERDDIQYERISTFIPVSTFTYLPDRTTKLPLQETSDNAAQFNDDQKNTLASTLKSTTTTTSTFDIVSSINDQELEKSNSTTITTQSVSPSTSVTFTQSTSTEQSTKKNNVEQNYANTKVSTTTVESEPMGSLFDVAQSISQIASDLGGAYRPTSSSNDLMESTLSNGMKLESKENLDIEIPSEVDNNGKVKIDLNNNTDNYIKISTIDPHDKRENTTTISKENSNDNINSETTSSPTIASITTLDPVLSESMGDLLSQVVNEGPDNKFDGENLSQNDEKSSATELPTVVTTEYKENFELTTEVDINSSNIVISSEAPSVPTMNIIKGESSMKTPIENTEITDRKDYLEKVSTINSALSEDKSTITISVSNINPNIRNDTVQLSTENEEVAQFNTENTKSPNSTLPSYKSETEQSPEDKDNDSNVLDKTNFDSDRIEQKEFVGIKLSDKVSETKVPPKVEDFKKKIQKVNIDDKELGSDRNNSWKLIPTVSPTKIHEMKKNSKDKPKTDIYNLPENEKNIILDFSKENQGLELTTKDLSEDVAEFTNLCNELAFRYWNDLEETMDAKRSFVFSPYAVTSMLAMMFMGARGATSGEMNEILKLDDMVTFNPHFTLKNISDSIEMTPASGVAVSAFIRELYSDRNKGKILTFYKERVQHFYNGHVEEVNFKLISDIIRRRTNLLVKRYTWGKILEFMKTNTIVMQPPLAAFSANIFQTDCSGTSVDGRDGELYFVVSPNVRQRRLVPVPAVVYKTNFLAGYEPTLDATAAALGNINSIVSTIFVMPGQQGNIVHAEDLEELEKRLLGTESTTTAWNRLLRTLLPRVGLELQIPRYSHKSTFNISSTLQRMGLKDLFDEEHADLGGLNGPSKDLYLSDMIQSNTFVTCGENVIGEQHHIEQYPELQKRRSARWVHGWDEPRDYQRAFHDPHDVGEAMHLPLHLRPRQARLPARNAQPARLKFDRPFLFFVRHNPSGMILYVGRYNPRLLP